MTHANPTPAPTADPTLDPALTSWVPGANDGAADFPVQNLPFGVIRRRTGDTRPRCAVAIGACAIDLSALHEAGLFAGTPVEGENVFDAPFLNRFMSMGRAASRAVRARLSVLLRADTPTLRDDAPLRARAVLPLADVDALLPVYVGDYTDFYASVHHATNVGSMFRPDNPLLPNYKHIPIGYHGRASSIVVSGAGVRRPRGQTKADDADAPTFGPCKLLDYELEVGVYVGQGNALGAPIPIERAEEHLFGVCLVNDWSARDVQKWEYQPLGPFLAKSFATTVSPWIVTMDALAPFRTRAFARPDGDPRPLPYLVDDQDQRAGGIGLTLEVSLASAQMREKRLTPARVSIGDFGGMYWTFAQMLAHHTSNGCNMRPGDMYASGTVSGTTPESRGCLLERTWAGAGKPRTPIELPTGEKRVFLEDGDEVVIRGWCERAGARRIGLGVCRGVVVGAENGANH